MEQFLDEHNARIWTAIQRQYDIQCFRHARHHIFSRCHGDILELHLPQIGLSYELFTFELLRLDLRLCKHIYIADYLVHQYHHEPLLSWTFTENLFVQVGSLLENSKIRPLLPGGKWDMNLVDGEMQRPGLTALRLSLIKRGFTRTIPALSAVDLYLHCFFSEKSAHTADRHAAHLQEMEQLRPDLYHILEVFWRRWDAFKIEHYDPVNYTYKEFTALFVHAIGQWAIQHVQIK